MASPAPSPDASIELRVTDSAGAAALADDVWRCYDAVFGDVTDPVVWRTDRYDRHAARDGYRLVTAHAADHAGDDLVGFAWGYVGQRGQYWSDLLVDRLPDDVADAWVGDHFELVELGVLAAWRGHGVGRRLHDAVLDGVGRRSLLLTSDDEDDPAVRLYRRSGWQPLGPLGPGTQVMGRPAPR
ncbi:MULTISPECIES: GNAT family N-acetyltransferase [unclassified Isoptericola]|uniref:GNAT family N-acetyltransferase n=1 Tax=unclassified Isoptericola TaxID=2623355 RepID=UPI00366344C7